jgi:hypothetical protein
MSEQRWLPEDFTAPARLDLPTGDHLRPIRAEDIDIDYPTVMANQVSLWESFGEVWGWPPTDMTYEQDLADLQRHVAEMARNESFNYALLDADETTLKGCVYIDPPERAGADADISWWLVDEERSGPLERALRRVLPTWIAEAWPFDEPRFIGIDLTWDEWSQLPEIEG